MALMYFGPNDLHPTEVLTSMFLITGWWGVYPKVLLDKAEEKLGSTPTMVVAHIIYWCILVALIWETAEHVITLSY